MTTSPRSWALATTTLCLVLSAGVSYSGQKQQTAPVRDEMRKILAEGHDNREKRRQTKDEAAQEALDAGLRPILSRARLGLGEIPAGRGDQVRFVRVVLNSTGAGSDAVRFRTPATGEEFRLVWEIVVPGNNQTRNLQEWNIVSLDGPAPIAEFFSRRDSFDLPSSGFPDENFCITPYIRGQPLRSDAEYILWFDFTNDKPTPAFVKVGLTAVETDADEEETPRRAAAPKTRSKFQTSTKSLNQRYDVELKGLRKSYLATLDKAAKTAAQQKDAQETDRIIGEADEIVRGGAAAAGRRGFQLLRAHYGVDQRWLDVTDQLRPLIRGDVLRFGLGADFNFKEDPAFGVLKQLIIVYSLDGNTGVSITADSQRVELPPTAPILDRIPPIGSYEP
ncbi:MAG: hypothetical protein P4L85_02005 [Paludisphaera borealis]|uniref:hypothetical protein n=1 Tax=Paludisphaera borealis TaxID=1387353 RepID=UPI00284AC583|nr:hypothetical protein [Paludisphaera borealis]MDR3618095.1 hypothetical protein [Paludisphaera borealis]